MEKETLYNSVQSSEVRNKSVLDNLSMTDRTITHNLSPWSHLYRYIPKLSYLCSLLAGTPVLSNTYFITALQHTTWSLYIGWSLNTIRLSLIVLMLILILLTDFPQFVAHPNCQQHLTNIWYGKDMSSLQSMSVWKKVGLLLLFIPAMPLACLMYIINPYTKVSTQFSSSVTQMQQWFSLPL